MSNYYIDKITEEKVEYISKKGNWVWIQYKGNVQPSRIYYVAFRNSFVPITKEEYWKSEKPEGLNSSYVHSEDSVPRIKSKIVNYYNNGDAECMNVIESVLDKQGTIDFCLGNAMKYLWRCSYKEKFIENIDKTIWYLNKAKELSRK